MNKFVLQCSFNMDQKKQFEEFATKMEVNGDALVQFDEKGQFYYLCSSNCNLQQHYTENGWLIVYSHPFNKDLMIGVGLHEHTFIAGYYYTLEDEEKVRMWNDIINFAFHSKFHRIFYPLENYFKGFFRLNGNLCLYLYDYIPVSRGTKVGSEQKKITNLLFRFKEGVAITLTVKLFSLAISRIYAIKNRRNNSILIPIPASTNSKNKQRYATFCHVLSQRCGIENGFDAIRITSDREELKGTRNSDKVSNLEFDPSHFRNKQVILVDDVLNTGDGFLQISQRLLDLGARRVIGIFLVKTLSSTFTTFTLLAPPLFEIALHSM